LTTIQAELARWQHRRQQVNAWLTQLTQLAVQLRAAYDTLSRTAETWVQTREAVRAEQAPPAILQQVAATLTAIEAAQARLKLQEDSVLKLQGKLAAELNRCNDALDQISRAQKSTVAGMLGRENLPIWSHELWSKGGAVLPQRLVVVGVVVREHAVEIAEVDGVICRVAQASFVDALQEGLRIVADRIPEARVQSGEKRAGRAVPAVPQVVRDLVQSRKACRQLRLHLEHILRSAHGVSLRKLGSVQRPLGGRWPAIVSEPLPEHGSCPAVRQSCNRCSR